MHVQVQRELHFTMENGQFTPRRVHPPLGGRSSRKVRVLVKIMGLITIRTD
eukprot:COSAG01_NODE_41593_length_449_cov_2.040000_1_plen_51_part_00